MFNVVVPVIWLIIRCIRFYRLILIMLLRVPLNHFQIIIIVIIKSNLRFFLVPAHLYILLCTLETVLEYPTGVKPLLFQFPFTADCLSIISMQLLQFKITAFIYTCINLYCVFTTVDCLYLMYIQGPDSPWISWQSYTHSRCTRVCEDHTKPQIAYCRRSQSWIH